MTSKTTTGETYEQACRKLLDAAIDMGDATIAQLCARALCGDQDAMDEALGFADSLAEMLADDSVTQ